MNNQSRPENNRRMLLTTDLLDVSVQVQPRNGECFDLHGQVLPLLGIDPQLCSVELISNEGEKRMAETDELGFFEFKELCPRNAYRLIVTGAGFEITMPERVWCDAESSV